MSDAPATSDQDDDDQVLGDVFFELPLSKWNMFESQSLLQSKIVLLSDLHPVVDMFNDDGVGVGARSSTEIVSELKLSDKDRERLIALLGARSYDVYSVRAAMSDKLSDEELERIKIPEAEKKRLQFYLNNYSRGLLSVILEGTDIEITNRSSLSTILQGQNREKVLKNLIDIANRLRIEPEEIVNYIGKLSEVILAISYYHRVYDNMIEGLKDLLLEVRKMQSDAALCVRFPGLKDDATLVLEYGRDTLAGLNKYFNEFKKVERFFDTEISPEKFKSLRDGVEAHFRAIGKVLCYWQIKTDGWHHRFIDSRGRLKDSTSEQRYNYFKEELHYNIYLIQETLDIVKTAEIPL
ncbi:MAG: hypothetical protein GKS03_10545 [Alphaproteobacteria bacterium]|nr:hypothetical protein [Alphaproteobacteria bacterium]